MEQKQEQKQEQKVEVIQPKLCPFISGFIVEPVKKNALGQVQFGKTTNVAPCMENSCMFYDGKTKNCGIWLGIDCLIALKIHIVEGK